MAVIRRRTIPIYIDVTGELSREVAEKIAKLLESKQFKVTLPMSDVRYAVYTEIQQANAEYTLQLEVKRSTLDSPCAARPMRVENCTGSPCRDTVEAGAAAKCLGHALKITGRKAITGGNTEVPWEEIKSLPWFWESHTPYINVQVSCPPRAEDQLAAAIVNGILAYFKRT